MLWDERHTEGLWGLQIHPKVMGKQSWNKLGWVFFLLKKFILDQTLDFKISKWKVLFWPLHQIERWCKVENHAACIWRLQLHLKMLGNIPETNWDNFIFGSKKKFETKFWYLEISSWKSIFTQNWDLPTLRIVIKNFLCVIKEIWNRGFIPLDE